LLEMRRIAAHIYKKNKRWGQSVALSKADSMYKDAIDTTACSKDTKLAEELLEFFVGVKDNECFAATLYTCYEMIRPDVALELAFRYNLMDYVMPYMIQVMREISTTVKDIDERTAKKKEEAVDPSMGMAPNMGFGMSPMLQLSNEAYNPAPMGYGMPQPGYGAPGGYDAGYQQPGYGAAPMGYGQPGYGAPQQGGMW
jgi:clathrin heavy chain